MYPSGCNCVRSREPVISIVSIVAK
jgi:hypothetical protein